MGHDLEVHYPRPAGLTEREAVARIVDDAEVQELHRALWDSWGFGSHAPDLGGCVRVGRTAVKLRAGPRWGVFFHPHDEAERVRAVVARRLCRGVGVALGASTLLMSDDQGAFQGPYRDEHPLVVGWEDIVHTRHKFAPLRLVDLTDMVGGGLAQRESNGHFYLESLHPHVLAIQERIDPWEMEARPPVRAIAELLLEPTGPLASADVDREARAQLTRRAENLALRWFRAASPSDRLGLTRWLDERYGSTSLERGCPRGYVELRLAVHSVSPREPTVEAFEAALEPDLFEAIAEELAADPLVNAWPRVEDGWRPVDWRWEASWDDVCRQEAFRPRIARSLRRAFGPDLELRSLRFPGPEDRVVLAHALGLVHAELRLHFSADDFEARLFGWSTQPPDATQADAVREACRRCHELHRHAAWGFAALEREWTPWIDFDHPRVQATGRLATLSQRRR